jgi:hypothetical protein
METTRSLSHKWLCYFLCVFVKLLRLFMCACPNFVFVCVYVKLWYGCWTMLCFRTWYMCDEQVKIKILMLLLYLSCCWKHLVLWCFIIFSHICLVKFGIQGTRCGAIFYIIWSCCEKIGALKSGNTKIGALKLFLVPYFTSSVEEPLSASEWKIILWDLVHKFVCVDQLQQMTHVTCGY